MRTGVIYKGLALLVDYDYLRPYRGAREPVSGLPLDPDESADIQINGICLACDCHSETEITQIMSSNDFQDIEHEILLSLREEESLRYADW